MPVGVDRHGGRAVDDAGRVVVGVAGQYCSVPPPNVMLPPLGKAPLPPRLSTPALIHVPPE